MDESFIYDNEAPWLFLRIRSLQWRNNKYSVCPAGQNMGTRVVAIHKILVSQAYGRSLPSEQYNHF
jgi:hypothetical protein